MDVCVLDRDSVVAEPGLFDRIRTERILAFQEAITIVENGGGDATATLDKLHMRLAEIRANKG